MTASRLRTFECCRRPTAACNGRFFRNRAWIRIRTCGLLTGETSCVGLARGRAQMYPLLFARRQVVLSIAFIDQAQGSSSQYGWVLERCSSEAKPGLPKAREGNFVTTSLRIPFNSVACRRCRNYSVASFRCGPIICDRAPLS